MRARVAVSGWLKDKSVNAEERRNGATEKRFDTETQRHSDTEMISCCCCLEW
jgi:hypothetical protein